VALHSVAVRAMTSKRQQTGFGRAFFRGFFREASRLAFHISPATILFSFILVLPVSIVAHDGPPFPLLVDQRVGPCFVSVWTDPDVGTGTFFIIASPPAGNSLPEDLKVEVLVQPVNGRLAEVSYPAEREVTPEHLQFKSLVQFDNQELWRVRIKLHSGQGDGETIATVEATPPGLGRWDLLIYLSPFLAVAFLWLMAFMRRRHRAAVP
jgi:hypothetical protein